MILKPNYNVFCVDNGKAALQMIQEIDMDVITLDLRMPTISGMETLKEIRMINPDVMVIIITGYGTLNTAIEAIRYGVFDYIPKPFNVPEIMCIIGKAIQRKKLNSRIRQILGGFLPSQRLDPDAPPVFNEKTAPDCGLEYLNPAGNQSCLEFAKVLSATLEEKDPYTSGHSERVCHYSDAISERLSFSLKDRNELQIASYLHDIGKIGISNRFINKKGTLTSTDWAIIKQHTRKSIELLVPLSLSDNILSCIHHHHERFDGTGYPDGLEGDRIPLGARIITVADSYDGMTSDRPYRKPLCSGEAKNELVRHAGRQFDPHLVSVFLDILMEKEEVFRVVEPAKFTSFSLKEL
jgi:response regulator RpfG family c-di-GMP phosphodiesterase